MSRVVLTSDSGKWFDDQKAIAYEEASRWNGNNLLSRATGSQWEHERLYYTRSGNWVLCYWSQWEGTLSTHEEIHEESAIAWLISQEHFDDIDELPAGVQERIRAGVEAAEL